jgi:hypothetical protein
LSGPDGEDEGRGRDGRHPLYYSPPRLVGFPRRAPFERDPCLARDAAQVFEVVRVAERGEGWGEPAEWV